MSRNAELAIVDKPWSSAIIETIGLVDKGRPLRAETVFEPTGLPMAVELCAAFSAGGTWRVA